MLQYFRINIIVRVLILVALALGLSFSIYYEQFVFTIISSALLIFIVVSFIHYVNQTNRDLATFFTAVQYNDYTTNTSTTKVGAHYEDVYKGINLVNRKFQDIRAEKEANHQFLQALVQHVDVGLLCIKRDGEVVLMNKALQEILRKSYLLHLEGIKKIDAALYESIIHLQNGERRLIKAQIKNNLLQLAIQSVDIKLQNEAIRILSFQNIQNELEAQELDAWQKLIRILTHEIMNSVSPISSLSSTLSDMLENPEELDASSNDQIRESLAVINKRAEGLLSFTDTYRKLTRIPNPVFTTIDVAQFMANIETLYSSEFTSKHITFQKHLARGLQCKGDPNLLEQVFINLVKNAIEAVENTSNPIVEIAGFNKEDGKICLQVSDNGVGISEEHLEQIFVPFFSTKSHGSGIGLSLSRQIVQMHKGKLTIRSTEGEGTLVTILI